MQFINKPFPFPAPSLFCDRAGRYYSRPAELKEMKYVISINRAITGSGYCRYTDVTSIPLPIPLVCSLPNSSYVFDTNVITLPPFS